ncbi:MAG: ATP-binding protein [Candidatus Zixiibacteriota bacterium]
MSRSMEATADLHDACEKCLKENGVPENDIFAILLGIEEIYTNFVKYNPNGGDRIDVRLECRSDRVVASLTDYEANRFDPREAPPARLEMPLHERKPGGLGIHIVKQMMNEVDYSYKDRVSKVTLTRLIGKG